MPSKVKLLNKAEELTHSKLEKVCERFDARVFSKVRLADTLVIDNSGLNDSHYTFALKSHFDFVVTDKDTEPLFSVEYDGPSHSSAIQRKRDEQKNAICSHLEHPLLRINSRYINRDYRGIDLLSYFVSVWFMREEYFEAQESGYIPYDEIFDPAFIVSTPEVENEYPYWLTLEIQLKIQKLYKKHKVNQMVPSFLIGVDQNGNYHCISWLKITDYQVVCERSAMKAQNFPILVSDTLSMIIMFDLYDSIKNYFRNGRDDSVISKSNFSNKLKIFQKNYGSVSGFHCPTRKT